MAHNNPLPGLLCIRVGTYIKLNFLQVGDVKQSCQKEFCTKHNILIIVQNIKKERKKLLD